MVCAGDDRMPQRSKLHARGDYLYAVCGFLGPAHDTVILLQDWLKRNALDVSLGEIDTRRQLQSFFVDFRAAIPNWPPEGACDFDVAVIDVRHPAIVLNFSRSAQLVGYIDLSAGSGVEGWGSGADFAKGAMLAGVGPREAVQIAAMLTVSTSAETDFIPVEYARRA
jgi:hypothetical protein